MDRNSNLLRGAAAFLRLVGDELRVVGVQERLPVLLADVNADFIRGSEQAFPPRRRGAGREARATRRGHWGWYSCVMHRDRRDPPGPRE